MLTSKFISFKIQTLNTGALLETIVDKLLKEKRAMMRICRPERDVTCASTLHSEYGFKACSKLHFEYVFNTKTQSYLFTNRP